MRKWMYEYFSILKIICYTYIFLLERKLFCFLSALELQSFPWVLNEKLRRRAGTCFRRRERGLVLGGRRGLPWTETLPTVGRKVGNLHLHHTDDNWGVTLQRDFSTSVGLTFWAWQFFVVGRSGHWRMLSSVPGLHPLDASGRELSAASNPNVSRCSGEGKIASGEPLF